MFLITHKMTHNTQCVTHVFVKILLCAHVMFHDVISKPLSHFPHFIRVFHVAVICSLETFLSSF